MPARLTHHQQQGLKLRNEEIYAAVACDVLGARWRRVDAPGGPPGMRDFDLVFPDGHTDALEVCTFTEGDAEAQESAFDGNRRLVTWTVSRVWWVYVPPRGLDIRDFISGRTWSRIETAVAALDDHGYERFNHAEAWSLVFRPGTPPAVAAAAKDLVDIGVQFASSLEVREEGVPYIELMVTSAGYIDPGRVNAAVEDRADPGNMAKLRAATTATARHLFVPITLRAPLTFGATRHMLGTPPPNVPSDLARVWVMGSPDHDVLFVEPPGPWQSAPFSPRAHSHPEEWELSYSPAPPTPAA